MNREDLLKKCVDRGVADETSVGTVSHLFYVYLLSALQKGQRVEIPNFGTFGTRVVGVKRARRMPYFEVEKELADKVNERYRDLKYLVLGKYELISALGEEEYTGKEFPHDTIVDQLGKEILVDTHRDVTIEEYERSLAVAKGTKPFKEKRLMPKLNLKDEGMEPETIPGEGEPTVPPPTLRDTTTRGGGPSPLLQVLIAVLVLGALTFALNYFGVIHLWGGKPSTVIEALPEPEVTPPVVDTSTMVAETPTPTPTPPRTKPKTAVPASSAGGRFTIQVSSWVTPSKANQEAQRLTAAGYDAFVEDAMVSGETWHRVRVGRYATEKEAATAASQLQQMLENGIWVARVGK
jgi:septal ring-binding cell division protein DamX